MRELTPLLWVLIPVALSMAGSVFVRRRYPHDVLREHHDVAGFIYSAIGVVYAVVLGLVLVAVWEQQSEAQELVTIEASTLAAMYRDASVLPQAQELELQSALRGYRDMILDDEWQELPHGRAGASSGVAMHRVYNAVHAIEPTTPREQQYLQKLIEDLDDLADAAQQRLQSSRTALPPVLWAIIIVGGLVVVLFSYLFGTPSAVPGMLVVGALTAIVAMTIMAVAALDRPFTGAARVTPDAFVQLESVFQAWDARATQQR